MKGITLGSVRDGSLSALMARNVPDEIMKMAEEHSDGKSSRMYYCQILYKVQNDLKSRLILKKA